MPTGHILEAVYPPTGAVPRWRILDYRVPRAGELYLRENSGFPVVTHAPAGVIRNPRYIVEEEEEEEEEEEAQGRSEMPAPRPTPADGFPKETHPLLRVFDEA